MALLYLGITINPFQLVIPQDTETVLTGYCSAECTKSGLPDEGVSVFGTFLHGHTAANAVTLRHIRDGFELEPMEINEHYDFDYQQITVQDEPRTILPGDQFMVHCSYNTAERDHVTTGGLETSFVEWSLSSATLQLAFHLKVNTVFISKTFLNSKAKHVLLHSKRE